VWKEGCDRRQDAAQEEEEETSTGSNVLRMLRSTNYNIAVWQHSGGSNNEDSIILDSQSFAFSRHVFESV
jgi:hypothetical protein